MGVDVLTQAEDRGEDEHLEWLPAVVGGSVGTVLLDAAPQVVPAVAALFPYTLAQLDGLLHFGVVGGVSAKKAQEADAAKELVEVVEVVGIVWVDG